MKLQLPQTAFEARQEDQGEQHSRDICVVRLCWRREVFQEHRRGRESPVDLFGRLVLVRCFRELHVRGLEREVWHL